MTICISGQLGQDNSMIPRIIENYRLAQTTSEQLLFGIDGNKYKAPQLDKEEREWDISALRLNWDVFIKSLPSRLRALCGRGIGKALIVQVMEHSKEVVSSRQKRTDEHINSWRLRQHAQGLIFPFVSHAGFLSTWSSHDSPHSIASEEHYNMKQTYYNFIEYIVMDRFILQ